MARWRLKGSLPPPDWLRDRFWYDPDTGVLVWRGRGLGDFPDDGVFGRWNDRFCGRPAGYRGRKGHGEYLTVGVTYSGVYLLIPGHRLIWALASGRWPEADIEIDHRDGDGLNNRLDNLRLATGSQQGQNKLLSPLCGAHKYKRTGRYSSGIQVDGKRLYLGYFPTAAEAHAAYLEAKRVHHPFQPGPRIAAE